MKLRVVTQAEQDLLGTEPQLWPTFMSQDKIVNAFWPRLYELYPDFQLWVLDGKRTVAYACTLPVRWDGIPEPGTAALMRMIGAATAPGASAR